MTLNISWSGIRTHEECKQKGYLKRQRKSATLENTRNYFPGNITDRVVRDWLLNDPRNNPGIMPDMVDSIIDREKAKIEAEGGVMKWRDSKDREKVREDCIEAVTKIEPALQKLVVPFRFRPDFKFKAPIDVPHPNGGVETINLIGFMDIIVHDDKDRWFVWDVKHTRDDSYWRKTVGQLGFYDLAVTVLFGQPTQNTGLLQPLCKQEVLPYQNTEERRAQLMQRVVGMAQDIWRDDKTPRADTKHCGFCEVRHACTKFEPVLDSKGRKRVSF